MRSLADLRIEIDWQPADDSVRAPELRATFARVEIWVGDHCVTRSEDALTGSSRRSIVVSLYPLAEWLVFNWWRLQYDGRPSLASPLTAFRSHSTSFAGDGFCWPDLRSVPEGDLIRLQWHLGPPRDGWPLRFLSSGTARAERAQVVSVLDGIIEAALVRLREAGVPDTTLEKEWAAQRSLDAEEAEFCRASARLGLDPFAVDDDLARLIDQIWTSSGDLAIELFDAATSNNLQADVAWLTQTIKDLRDRPNPGVAEDLVEHVRSAVRSSGTSASTLPWDVGWAAARRARDAMSLLPTDPLPKESVFDVRTSELSDSGVVGAGVGASMVATRRMGSLSQRFAEGRALWHSASAEHGEPYLLTRSASTAQAIGRAFAAELLVPGAGLRELVGGDIDDEEIARIGDHFLAPEQVVLHQVENQLMVG